MSPSSPKETTSEEREERLDRRAARRIAYMDATGRLSVSLIPCLRLALLLAVVTRVVPGLHL